MFVVPRAVELRSMVAVMPHAGELDRPVPTFAEPIVMETARVHRAAYPALRAAAIRHAPSDVVSNARHVRNVAQLDVATKDIAKCRARLLVMSCLVLFGVRRIWLAVISAHRYAGNHALVPNIASSAHLPRFGRLLSILVA